MNVYVFNNYFVGTAQKKYVKTAIKELEKIDSSLKVIDRFPDGIFTFKSSFHREVLFFKLKENPPVFLRHIHPVDRMFFLRRDDHQPEVIAEGVISLSDRIKPGKRIAVQARRIPGDYDYTLYTIKGMIDPVLKNTHKAIPTVKSPDKILSVFVADSTEIDYNESLTCSERSCTNDHIGAWQNVCLLGFSSSVENLSEWPGGEIRFKKEEAQASKSEYKLLEALSVFPIDLKKGSKVLDIGASPGGWTRVLNQKGCQVTAVDRAPLDREVSSLKGVSFVKRDVTHFRSDDNCFDLLTNNINRDPDTSVKAMLSVAPCIKKGAPFIMTIKLSGKKSAKQIEKTVKNLGKAYSVKGIKQLYNNKDEVTLWGAAL